MIDSIQALIDQYVVWLRDNTALRQLGEWVEITTPYLDRHNDCVQLYVRKNGDDILLTDDSYTIQDLQNSGCNLSSPKRQNLLRTALNGFGVQLEGDALVVRTSAKQFSLKKHNLLQAILAVSDLFYMAPATVANVFLEDVGAWLSLSDIRYIARVKFSGKSGYDHMFDFVIPASKQAPERVIKAINAPNRDASEALAFSWIDTREVRDPNSRLYAILNDSNQLPAPEVLEAFRSYDVRTILWSERGSVQEELVA